MAHPLLAQVRQRFRGRCGYCGVSEIDRGGELTIDHFVPSSAGGDDSLGNLIYCCARCNTYKGDFVPRDQAPDERLLHPLRDDPAPHFRLDASTGVLLALSQRGQFQIDLLRLNRPPLVEHRLRASLIELSLADLDALREETARLTTLIERYRELIDELKRGLDLPSE